MPVGWCKLCLKKKPLRQSHLLGRAFYKMCKEAGSDPVVMTPKIILPTSRQVKEYLLCEDCEQLFNSKGEEYVSTLVYDGTDFPLLERMNVSMTIKEEPNLLVYSASAMGLDYDKLAYFALSVFWRSSVREWTTIGDQSTFVEHWSA